MLCLSSVSASSNTSCPTWFYYDNSTQQCHCDPLLYCSTPAEGPAEIFERSCATLSEQKGVLYYIGKCPFRHRINSTNRWLAKLPSDPDMLDDVMCGPYNRKGLLCGECIDGYGPAVYSRNLKCSNCSKLGSEYFAVPLYFLLELTPIILFFIFLILFCVNITSGPLLGYLIFCQVITCLSNMDPELIDYILSDISPLLKVLLQASLSVSQFWSMHSFFKSLIPPFCISEKLTGIHIQLLPIISATYPVVLVIITCILMELHARNCRIIHILWKPFSIILNKTNTTAVTGDAVIQAFASFIFLSSNNIYYVLVSVSVNNEIVDMHGNLYETALYFDPTITYLSHQHVLYALIALVPVVFLTLIPSVLLILYPTRLYSRYLSRCLSARIRLAITTFAEALHKCFKDGLNGTRDYRSLAGLLFTGPIIYFSIRRVLLEILFRHQSDITAAFIALFSSIVVAHVRPCKLAVANFSISFNFFVIGIICVLYHLWNTDLNTPTQMLEQNFILFLLLPHVLVLVWAGYKISRRIKRYSSNLSGCDLPLTNIASGIRRHYNGGYHALD